MSVAHKCNAKLSRDDPEHDSVLDDDSHDDDVRLKIQPVELRGDDSGVRRGRFVRTRRNEFAFFRNCVLDRQRDDPVMQGAGAVEHSD